MLSTFNLIWKFRRKVAYYMYMWLYYMHFKYDLHIRINNIELEWKFSQTTVLKINHLIYQFPVNIFDHLVLIFHFKFDLTFKWSLKIILIFAIIINSHQQSMISSISSEKLLRTKIIKPRLSIAWNLHRPNKNSRAAQNVYDNVRLKFS